MSRKSGRAVARQTLTAKTVSRAQTASGVPDGSSDTEASVATVGVGGTTALCRRVAIGLAVTGLLTFQYALAGGEPASEENPTVDEVVHLAAGITYWQRGTFRLYHHNPPLVKLVAALPVLLGETGDGGALCNEKLESRLILLPYICPDLRIANVRRYFELFRAGPVDDAGLCHGGRSWSFLRGPRAPLRVVGRAPEPFAVGLFPTFWHTHD